MGEILTVKKVVLKPSFSEMIKTLAFSGDTKVEMKQYMKPIQA